MVRKNDKRLKGWREKFGKSWKPRGTIHAFEGHVEWFEGNFEEYEQDKIRRLEPDIVNPHRVTYKRLTR